MGLQRARSITRNLRTLMFQLFYLLSGRVKLHLHGVSAAPTVEFGTGDLVTVPKGTTCSWEVIEPVKKHFHFDPELSIPDR